MAPQLESKEAVVSTGTYKVTRTESSRGMVKPNLVLIRDSGKAAAEFRVQCEVLLPKKEDADQVEKMMVGDRRSLESALNVVKKNLHPMATATFRQIMDLAFQDQDGWNHR